MFINTRDLVCMPHCWQVLGLFCCFVLFVTQTIMIETWGLSRLNVDWVVHLHTFISTATFTSDALSMFVQTGQEVFVIVDAWGNYKCPFDSCGFSDTLSLCAGHCSPTLLSRSQQCFLLRVCTPASEGVRFSTVRLSSLFSPPILSLHCHIRLFV